MLGRPVDRLPDRVRVADVVLGVRGHRLAVRVGVRAERDAAVVRDVEPLVGVGRPRVGPLRARREVAERRARRGPQPERTVDVEPGARARRPRRRSRRGRRTHRCSPRPPGRRRSSAPRPPASAPRSALRVEPPVRQRVQRADLRPADAEVAQRAVDRRVALRADEHGERRRAGEALLGDVPADGGEHVLPRRGKAREVSGLAARDEGERRALRDPEQVLDPGAGGVLGDERRRAERAAARGSGPRPRRARRRRAPPEATSRRRSRSSARSGSRRRPGSRAAASSSTTAPGRSARPAAERRSAR